jgi:hypothetical protein
MVNNFTNINYHLSSQIIDNKKTMTYYVENPGPGLSLGQTQKCGGVKSVNRISTLPLFIG